MQKENLVLAPPLIKWSKNKDRTVTTSTKLFDAFMTKSDDISEVCRSILSEKVIAAIADKNTTMSPALFNEGFRNLGTLGVEKSKFDVTIVNYGEDGKESSNETYKGLNGFDKNHAMNIARKIHSSKYGSNYHKQTIDYKLHEDVISEQWVVYNKKTQTVHKAGFGTKDLAYHHLIHNMNFDADHTVLHHDEVSHGYPPKHPIKEDKSHDFIQNELAKKDINSKVDGTRIYVHKDNVKQAKTIVKHHGLTHTVTSGLNEDFDSLTEKYDTHSWRTSKQENGKYSWSVHGSSYNKPTVTLDSGEEDTRAKAINRAKKGVMVYRRGLKEDFDYDAHRYMSGDVSKSAGNIKLKRGDRTLSSHVSHDAAVAHYKTLSDTTGIKIVKEDSNLDLQEEKSPHYVSASEALNKSKTAQGLGNEDEAKSAKKEYYGHMTKWHKENNRPLLAKFHARQAKKHS